jgi:hypothetical protein
MLCNKCNENEATAMYSPYGTSGALTHLVPLCPECLEETLREEKEKGRGPAIQVNTSRNRESNGE